MGPARPRARARAAAADASRGGVRGRRVTTRRPTRPGPIPGEHGWTWRSQRVPPRLGEGRHSSPASRVAVGGGAGGTRGTPPARVPRALLQNVHAEAPARGRQGRARASRRGGGGGASARARRLGASRGWRRRRRDVGRARRGGRASAHRARAPFRAGRDAAGACVIEWGESTRTRGSRRQWRDGCRLG